MRDDLDACAGFLAVAVVVQRGARRPLLALAVLLVPLRAFLGVALLLLQRQLELELVPPAAGRALVLIEGRGRALRDHALVPVPVVL